jgi:hypothetical protein
MNKLYKKTFVCVFSEWSEQNDGDRVNFEEITPTELAEKLRSFYAETQPKQQAHREKND